MAIVDAAAMTHNVREFVRHASPAMVCAVVKANGYGHGAITMANAALRGGATWLAVALVEEAIELREAGIFAPILLLSEFPLGAAAAIVEYDVTPTLYSLAKIGELAAAAADANRVCGVHLKVDTGMHRVGAQPDDVLVLCRAIAAESALRLAGTFTHFAMADDADSGFTDLQLNRFDSVIENMRAENIDPGLIHSSNSAGAIAHTNARYDMVRAGISMYGHDPDVGLLSTGLGYSLQPVLQLVTEISHVKLLNAGERLSYGLRYRIDVDSIIATIPIGYADGVPRRLSAVGGEVLLHGQRIPMAGRVTMDQILLDCGAADRPFARRVAVGDAVVLLGNQGDERITPWDWATRLDTISYEITCGISNRVPRRVVDGEPGGKPDAFQVST